MSPTTQLRCCSIALALVFFPYLARAEVSEPRSVSSTVAAPPLPVVPAATTTSPRVPTRALEIGTFLGYGGGIGKQGDIGEVLRSRRGGFLLTAGVLYRTRYFLSPFVDAGFYQLYASRNRVDLGSLGGVTDVNSTLNAVGFVSGFALDAWRLRFKGGVGLFDVIVRSEVLGDRLATSELDMGYVLGIGGHILQRDRVKIGLELRAVAIVEAGMGVLALGLSIDHDALRF